MIWKPWSLRSFTLSQSMFFWSYNKVEEMGLFPRIERAHIFMRVKWEEWQVRFPKFQPPPHSRSHGNDVIQAGVYTKLPEVTDSVMFRLFRERPNDCREDEDDAVLEDSEGGRAGLAVLPVSAFNRSFSAFSISISFCCEGGKYEKKKKSS